MDIPDEHMREIGRVVVYFTRLEHLLHSALILELLGDFDSDGRGNAIFADMGFDQKLNAFESMMRIADKTPKNIKHPFSEVKAIMGRARDKRNIVSHHTWTEANGIVHKSTVRLRKGTLNIALDEVPIEELLEIAHLISDARAALYAFCMTRFFPTSKAPQVGQ